MARTFKDAKKAKAEHNKHDISRNWKKSCKKVTNRNIRHAAKASCEVIVIDNSATRIAWESRAAWCREQAIKYLKECAYWEKKARNLKDVEVILDECVISKQRFWMD